MKFDELNEKLIVSFNELEINNDLMIKNFIKWISKKDFFQKSSIYLCRWQSIKNPTRFQELRGYLPDISLKNKIIKKFSIKQVETTYYFAICEINKNDFIFDFVLKHCFIGQLFFINENVDCNIVLNELEHNLNKDDNLIDKLNRKDFTKLLDLSQCKLLQIEQYDNPINGVCEYTFSIVNS